MSALGTQSETIQSEHGVVPLASFLELFEWAAAKLEDPLFGVRAAEETSPGDYGILGHLVSNCPTLRESAALMERYHGIFTTDFSYRFSSTEDTASCTYFEAPLPGTNSQQDILFSMAVVLKIVREHATPDWRPLKCYFTFPQPDDISPYQDYFGENLGFDHPTNTFQFEVELLDAPTANADPSLVPILLQQANQLLDKIQAREDLVEKVRLLIVTSLGKETITTVRAAERLNMSVRSLHRQLGLRNTSFKKLREDVIMKVAKEALLDTDFSITDIATRLSYSETSAFDRVFKRLTGNSPRQYRQKVLAQP